MKKYFYKIRRYILFLFQVIFIEKPKGLDFTMFNTSALKSTDGKYHGYSKTNEKHLKQIFEVILKNANSRELSIIDVGCGKGVVVKEAAAYPFKGIGGVELMPDILEIARRNMEILGIEKAVNLYCCDATKFQHYGDYNIFFFFNPFSKEIFNKVLEQVKRSVGDREIYIIYHHPVFKELLENTGMVKVDTLFDKLKQYETFIYRGRFKSK